MTAKGTRPGGLRPRHGHDPHDDDEADLLADVRRALNADHPIALLALVSTLLAAVDPRRANPFERARGDAQAPSRAELLNTFAEVDRVETTALLAAWAALGADDIERRRLARLVPRRDHRLPPWLSSLGAAHVHRAVEMTHVLGDGENVVLGARLATGEELTAVVYVDHNLGTVVKDAFIVPEPLDAVLRLMGERNADPNATLAELPLPDARARVTEAVETGAMTFPPFETDTWPACRPLVEWMVGLLPPGGRGYERPEWAEPDRVALADRFFTSGLGAPLHDPDHRDLLDALLWFGCDYGPGDPMRWSPVSVELLLADWIPRKLVAGADYLSKAPTLLRAFIRFCHRERAVPPELTAQTLDAVDRWEPDYQATIRSPRPQGPAALLAALGLDDPDAPWELANGPGGAAPFDHRAALVELLERAVGGPEALESLDDEPLPDEPFDWAGIPDDTRQRVGEVLALLDSGCDALLDVEHRTACRRVLSRIAVNGPEVFRRRGRADTAAAAICWAVCRVNDTFDQRQGGFTQKRLLDHFGLRSGISQRADTLLHAGGFPPHHGDLSLGSPDYLVAARRRAILDRHARFAG